MTVDRTPQPCHHKRANHQHGTRACYVLDRCRCIPCKDANRAAERQRTRDHLYGRWNGYVDATPAREHVQRLQAQGMGWKRIARAAGLDTSVVWKLLYGDASRNLAPSKRVRPVTAEKLLAVRLDLADGLPVGGIGTARRIQALVALGWSMSKIAARLGILRANFTPIAHGRRDVKQATAKAVRDLYDELRDTEPPRDTHRDRIAYSRARNFAAAHGWALPMAWDDESIDDPAAAPHTEEQTRPGGKRVYVEDIEFLLDDQPLATAKQIGERLGVSRDAVQVACRRDERLDLLATLARNADLKGAAA